MAHTNDLRAASPSVIAARAPLLPELGNGHAPVSALTPRQREIAGLLARGLANADIARQLVLTTGTVANHVASILQRLQLDSRTQIAAWAVEHGLHGGQDRLLTTLERLLEVEPGHIRAAMDQVAGLVAEALRADVVNAFLYEETTASLVAIGTSDSPLGRKQRALGLDRLAIADGGRVAQVFITGQAHFDGDVQQDQDELVSVRRELNVRSQLAVPLEIGTCRGVLTAQSTQLDFFAERDLHFLRAVSRWVASTAQRLELADRNAATALELSRRLAAEELVTVLAHDLRNYLAPISGRVDLLHRRAAREGHTSNLRDSAELRKSVGRLGRLISDLLDVARIDQGLFELTPAPMDLAAVVRETAAALEIPGIAIEVESTDEVRVLADPTRIRQAVENLLANAVQHAPQGTPVGVHIARQESAGTALAIVDITDHGPGINPTLLPRLFERFARSPNSDGLGIGLFLARQIAKAHGGGVEVKSASRNETQFRLYLPVEHGRPSV